MYTFTTFIEREEEELKVIVSFDVDPADHSVNIPNAEIIDLTVRCDSEELILTSQELYFVIDRAWDYLSSQDPEARLEDVGDFR